MTVRELREKYLRFFESKGHSRYPSGSLVPYDVTGRLDESLLFNGAGMVQFKPYFRGIAKPENPRLTTCQKCVRTGDIEEVGNPSHLTFFEMLGNFSFGDYFKAQAIAYSWEFLTSPEWLGLDKNRLAFTVFEDDDEAYAEWERWLIPAGIEPSTRIFRLTEETNYWPAGAFSSGPPGPCGPNSEMFYWVPSDEPPPSGAYTREDYLRDDKAGKWLEIWNDVFIQFEWQGHLKNPDRPADGYVKDGMPPLPFQSIDTGMGLERTTVVLSGLQSVYQTDAFTPIFTKLHEIAGESRRIVREASPGGFPEGGPPPVFAVLYGMAQGTIPDNEPVVRAARIIADHIRTAVFCIVDGVLPGNSGRGYVLRRLIRRAVLKGQRVLGFNDLFMHQVYEGVVENLGDHYPELIERRATIMETLKNEEAQFRRTLQQGLEIFKQELAPALGQSLATLNQQLKSNPHHELKFVAGVARILDDLSPDRSVAEYVHRSRHFLGDITLAHASQTLAAVRGALDQVGLSPNGALDISGDRAFFLYDTFGFPLEVTQELAEEAGLTVDVEGYELALKEAQERSRSAGGQAVVYGEITIHFDFGPTPTVFTGYQECETRARIVGAQPLRAEESSEIRDPSSELVVALDRTPFYAESGGQISDIGTIEGPGFNLKVLDVVKQDNVFVHLVQPDRQLDPEKLFNEEVIARVDEKRRAAIRRNHTATHLMHAALRNVLGKHVAQAGSYVGPDRLRFDFSHGKGMTQEELAEVEHIVNEHVLQNLPVVTHENVPINQAKGMGAMALFGEKYADFVRVVQIGDMQPQEDSFSRELCGGTHVRSTGEIGLFKIVSEASAASGIRRIEAISGEGAYEWARDLDRKVKEASALLKTSPADLVGAIERNFENQRELNKRIERMRTQSASGSQAKITELGPIQLAVEKLTEGEQKDATLVADRLSQDQPKRVTLVGLSADGKVFFVAKVGAEAMQAGAHAGNLVREVAKIAGGGGGGKPDFATAGGRQPEKVEEALNAAESILREMVKG
jgi:alanyl-tRNA synthetase